MYMILCWLPFIILLFLCFSFNLTCFTDDPRFSFLKKDHEYYPYYRCKMRLYNEVYGDIFKDTAEVSLAAVMTAKNVRTWM